MLAHILTDLHEALKKLHEWDALLAEFKPMLEAWKRTNGGTIGLLRARKAGRNGA